jgi:hypothetical protein
LLGRSVAPQNKQLMRARLPEGPDLPDLPEGPDLPDLPEGPEGPEGPPWVLRARFMGGRGRWEVATATTQNPP